MNKIIRTALLGLFFCTSSLLAQNNAGPVTHGPMLGHVTSNSVRVWVRTHQSGDFHINYGTDPENLDQTRIPSITTISKLEVQKPRAVPFAPYEMPKRWSMQNSIHAGYTTLVLNLLVAIIKTPNTALALRCRCTIHCCLKSKTTSTSLS